MKLRGIEFGRAFNASGARNFRGHDAWWFHKFAGLDYRGCTLVTKTTTLLPRKGFMPLERGTTRPREFVPKCIVVKPISGVVLNKVGLSGPGLKWLLDDGSWQVNAEPFVISIMAVEKAKADRLAEIQAMAELIAKERPDFCAPFALQINFSCPNVGHEQKEMVGEVAETLEILTKHLPGVPLMAKFNAILSTSEARNIAKHQACDAIVMGNTIPWGQMPERIDWKKLFGSDKSPLAGFGDDPGGGGLSGSPLLPIVCGWIHEARQIGIEKPIVACGGILDTNDVFMTKSAGASAIEVGSASILRPWRVQSIIDMANRMFE
jgi:dihydroorotate dehydrogenase (NAD+) catalytic subunit